MERLDLGLHRFGKGESLTADNNYDFFIPSNCVLNVQVDWSNAAGTLDGNIELKNSNNNVNYNSWGGGGLSFVIDSASGSNSFEDNIVGGQFVRLEFLKNNLSSIDLDVYITVKPN